MKMFTNSEQTAKLIELGFEKPCSIASVEPIYGMGGISVAKAYSVGELIEILPIYCWYRYDDREFRAQIQIKFYLSRWHIVYLKFEEDHCGHLYDCGSDELIDALYNMIVRLKEEGVI